MKVIKSELRTTLSDNYLEQCFYLAMSDYSPDNNQL